MKSRDLWKTALLGSQHLLVLPVSPYMVVEQLQGHGLVDIGVVIQRPGDDSEGEARPKCNARLARLARQLVGKPLAGSITVSDDRTRPESGTTDVLSSPTTI
jgi:hypothetical protein